MLREAVATVAGVVVVGGAATVVNNGDGSSTVTINEGGKQTSVRIEGNGRSYSCPPEVEPRITALTEDLGRLQITEKRVARRLKAIDRRYPGSTAPADVVAKYNAAVKEDKRLVRAYNKTVEKHNDLLSSECE